MSMEIKGKVHCFFEQSGTFKNEFRKLGIPAADYDIQNEYGQTDYKIDLFKEIENAYKGGTSVFDEIGSDDLIIAFFPCIYFCALSQMNLYFDSHNNRNLTVRQKAEAVIQRSQNRESYFRKCVEMISVAMERNIPLIMENPWSEQTFLKSNFIAAPAYIDMNRMERGDFVKPTAYWYFGCEPTQGFTRQNDKKEKTILGIAPSGLAGVCDKVRSSISPDYARDFICDKIVGKRQKVEQTELFNI